MRCLVLLQLTLLLALAACRSDKDRMAEIVDEWLGKEIVFPEVMTDFMTGDTIDLSDADFTIFTYVDSVGCTGCKMKLQFWNLFLNSLESISDAKIKMIIIADGVNINELKSLIERYDFNYPIYIDTFHRMSNSYIFPEEVGLQTFLLDRNKKVVTIGSPIYSSTILKMYSNLISGKTVISTDINTFVDIEPNRILLHPIRSVDSIFHSVSLINPSNDFIYIKKIIQSCDCIQIEIKDSVIPPESQKEVILKISNDATLGKFDGTIHIYYEKFDYPSIIKVLEME